jgi:hypothetical protein
MYAGYQRERCLREDWISLAHWPAVHGSEFSVPWRDSSRHLNTTGNKGDPYLLSSQNVTNRGGQMPDNLVSGRSLAVVDSRVF